MRYETIGPPLHAAILSSDRAEMFSFLVLHFLLLLLVASLLYDHHIRKKVSLGPRVLALKGR